MSLVQIINGTSVETFRPSNFHWWLSRYEIEQLFQAQLSRRTDRINALKEVAQQRYEDIVESLEE